MNNPPQIYKPPEPRQTTINIPTIAPPSQMDPAILHPVFFTDRLWKVAGAPLASPASPVSEGYVYREPQSRSRNGRSVEFGAKL